jgi:hypothetical protein
MKIVETSNFDLDDFNEHTVIENVPTKELAENICTFLNKMLCNSEYSSIYYRVKEDDYILSKFEP